MNKFIFSVIISVSAFFCILQNEKISCNETVQFQQPILGNIISPIENRGEAFSRWLKVSVRIKSGNVSGSGTICHYDRSKKLAYIISCGHLFKPSDKTCEIHAFYKNKQKLPVIQKYNANVICYTPEHSKNGDDISFISFTPDWDLDECATIAPINSQLIAGESYYSTGCDRAQEVALYITKYKGMRGKDLIFYENSPRSGRSGGGLMMKDSLQYIGICWGSEDPQNGSRDGIFVPLTLIHAYAKKNNLNLLLENEVKARKLPIINWTGIQKTFPPSYIPVP